MRFDRLIDNDRGKLVFYSPLLLIFVSVASEIGSHTFARSSLYLYFFYSFFFFCGINGVKNKMKNWVIIMRDTLMQFNVDDEGRFCSPDFFETRSNEKRR
jgi:hypothetical protein